jgi:hypothetical protein
MRASLYWIDYLSVVPVGHEDPRHVLTRFVVHDPVS